MPVFNLYLPCTCPVLALYLPCFCPVLGLQKGTLFNIARVIILQCGVWNSVVLCGSFRRTQIDPAFFHFQYTLYQILQCPATALRLPSYCPASVLQVSSGVTFHFCQCNNITSERCKTVQNDAKFYAQKDFFQHDRGLLSKMIDTRRLLFYNATVF